MAWTWLGLAFYAGGMASRFCVWEHAGLSVAVGLGRQNKKETRTYPMHFAFFAHLGHVPFPFWSVLRFAVCLSGLQGLERGAGQNGGPKRHGPRRNSRGRRSGE